MRRLLQEFKEGHGLEPTDTPVDSVTDAASRGGKATGFALSQLDDYLHRGIHPLVKDMSLYIYSMWVYRAERTPFAQDASSKQKRKPRHVEIPFHESYAAAKTWIQRIAKEPRVPKPEGYRFITDADAEMHYLLKAILLRPIYLPDRMESDESKQMMLLRAYRDLCTPPENEAPWPAISGGPGAPGPFERGWRCFQQKQRPLVLEAQKKTLSQEGSAQAWSSPSLWNTKEMGEELEEAREHYVEDDDAQESDEHGRLGSSARLSALEKNAPGRCGPLSSSWPFQPVHAGMLSVEEYNALQTQSIARNFDGIAHAQSEKPKRQIDRDVLIPEQPLYVEGAEGTSRGGEGQIENLGEDKAATLRQNVQLAHRFEAADLQDILDYNTAERRQAFVKGARRVCFHARRRTPAAGGAKEGRHPPRRPQRQTSGAVPGPCLPR